jgi:hypothetical protein
MNSKQNIQKTAYSLDQIESDMQKLSLLNENPPCIVISGLRHLLLTQMVKHNNYKSIIVSLFQILNIPVDWILKIKPSSYLKINEGKIPFDVHLYLIDDHIKIKVYKLLLNHLKRTKQTKLHLKIIN